MDSSALCRSRILTAAQELYGRGTFHALSIRGLAAAAGVTAATITRHFPDNDALLDGMADRGFELLEGYLHRGSGARSPESVLLAFLEFALEHRTEFDVMFLTPRRELRRFPSDFEKRRSITFRLACEAVQYFMREGALKPDDPLETTLTLWAHAHGLISMYFVGRFGRDPDRFRELYRRSIERVLNGLLTTR